MKRNDLKYPGNIENFVEITTSKLELVFIAIFK